MKRLIFCDSEILILRIYPRETLKCVPKEMLTHILGSAVYEGQKWKMASLSIVRRRELNYPVKYYTTVKMTAGTAHVGAAPSHRERGCASELPW